MLFFPRTTTGRDGSIRALRRLTVLIGLWLLVGGCRTAPPADDAERPSAFEAHGISLDLATPSTSFDASGGSLLLGEGWEPPQTEIIDGQSTSYAWAVDGSAWLWLAASMPSPSDLVGTCRALDFPAAPPQTVQVHLGEQILGRQTLGHDWHTLRVALDVPSDPPPDDAPQALQLTFAYAERPKDVRPGDLDGRRLSMACRELALVPRGAPFPELPHFEADGARLRMPWGSTVGWPLPARHRVTVQWNALDSDCPACPLRLDRVTGSTRHPLLEGQVGDAAPMSLQFDTGAALSRLELSFGNTGEATTGPTDAADSTLRLDLGSGGLSWTPLTGETESGALQTTAASGEGEVSSPPHIFVYLVDTLRADQLEPYGSAPGTTPAIAEFADDAVVYRAWSASAWTLPSVVSIFTGTYPLRHGVQRGDTRFDGQTFPSLAQRLSHADYHTVGISQSLIASHRFGLDRGFARFYLSNQLNGHSQRSQELRRFLITDLQRQANPERPVFAYLHGVAPHAPYVAHGPDRRWAEAHPGSLPAADYQPHIFIERKIDEAAEVAHLRALYQGEVAYADRQFGLFLDLLKHLDLYDRSVIVLLSDHGEEFAEHGGFDHGRTPYEEMLHVPLIVKYPRGEAAGTVIEQRVSTVDVAPTLLELAGLPLPPSLDGRPLPRAAPQGRAPRRAVAANIHPAPARTLAAVSYDVLAVDALKCIQSHNEIDQFGQPIPPWQVFDLSQDAAEQFPLDPPSDEVQRCRRMLQQWHEVQRTLGDTAPQQVTDEATREKLRSLGYID